MTAVFRSAAFVLALGIAAGTSLAAAPSQTRLPEPARAQRPLLEQATPSTFDAALARRVGADARGMRLYVLVILKSGPTPVTDAQARKAMFAGHFANIGRLAKAGKLVMAGPFEDNPDHWRGLFLLAVADVEQARALTAQDPVIRSGEMVAEYHPWYGSAAAVLLPGLHDSLVAPAPAGK